MIKKLTFLFLILAVIGCSSDDSETSNTNLVLVKKITETIYYSGDEQTRISNFTYQNNKLIGIDNGNGHHLQITYDGDKVVRSESYDADGPLSASDFTYNGSNLIKIQRVNNQEKVEYTYADGNVRSISYYGRANNEYQLLGIETFTFSNGNISQVINNNYQWDTSTSKTTYTYATGNNPFQDISIYLRLSLIFEGINPINSNIALSSNYYSNLNDALPSSVFRYETTYNTANFPIEIKKYGETNNLITKTVFEYN